MSVSFCLFTSACSHLGLSIPHPDETVVEQHVSRGDGAYGGGYGLLGVYVVKVRLAMCFAAIIELTFPSLWFGRPQR